MGCCSSKTSVNATLSTVMPSAPASMFPQGGLPSVVNMQLGDLKGMMFSDLMASRERLALKAGPVAAHDLGRVLQKASNVAPMHVVRATELRHTATLGSASS